MTRRPRRVHPRRNPGPLSNHPALSLSELRPSGSGPLDGTIPGADALVGQGAAALTNAIVADGCDPTSGGPAMPGMDGGCFGGGKGISDMLSGLGQKAIGNLVDKAFGKITAIKDTDPAALAIGKHLAGKFKDQIKQAITDPAALQKRFDQLFKGAKSSASVPIGLADPLDMPNMVHVNGLPATRLADIANMVSPPDVGPFVQGNPKVVINGMPAAGMIHIAIGQIWGTIATPLVLSPTVFMGEDTGTAMALVPKPQQPSAASGSPGGQAAGGGANAGSASQNDETAPLNPDAESKAQDGDVKDETVQATASEDADVNPTPSDEERLLCINSNRAEGDENSIGETPGFMDGHANLSLRTGETTTTYGLWPDDMCVEASIGDDPSENNIRVNCPNDDPGGYPYGYCEPITAEQQRQLETIANSGQDWTPTNNCASFASETFEAVTGTDIDADEVLGLETPRETGQHIIEANETRSE